MRLGVPNDVFPRGQRPRIAPGPMFFLTRAKRYFPLFRGFK